MQVNILFRRRALVRTTKFRYRTRNRVFNLINPKDPFHGLNKYILYTADSCLKRYGYPHAMSILSMLTGGITNEVNTHKTKKLRINMGRYESKRN